MTMVKYLKDRGAMSWPTGTDVRYYLPFRFMVNLVELRVPKWDDDELPTLAGEKIAVEDISRINEGLRAAKVYWSPAANSFFANCPRNSGWGKILWERLRRIEGMVRLSNDDSRVVMTRESGAFELEFLPVGKTTWEKLKGEPLSDLEATY